MKMERSIILGVSTPHALTTKILHCFLFAANPSPNLSFVHVFFVCVGHNILGVVAQLDQSRELLIPRSWVRVPPAPLIVSAFG